LLLRQKCPFPDTQEGRLNREGLHRLVDAWLDGVEFNPHINPHNNPHMAIKGK
jgi:hypothetical protein